MDDLDEQDRPRTPVTYGQHAHIQSPFLHGTEAALQLGAELVPGHRFDSADRVVRHVCSTALGRGAAGSLRG